MLKEATDKDFRDIVLKKDRAVLVDFYAAWCGPCMMQLPVLEELSNSRGIEYDIVKVNVEEAKKTVNYYNINTVPTLLFFKNGKLKKTMIGYMKMESINNTMNEQMAD